MGAPNSVVSDILQLCILAGKRRDNTGKENNLLTPEGIQPITQSGFDTWPHAALASELFTYTVPRGQCLVVVYVGLYIGLADGSDLGVDYGVPVYADTQWVVTNAGATVQKTPLLDLIAYVNTPTFFVFSGDDTPTLNVSVSTLITDDTVNLKAQMQGYLMDGSLYSTFRKYQTVPVTP